jgi:hypothetical protein
MEQILIQVKSKEKARMLLELLRALDFVELVKTSSLEEAETDTPTPETSLDFFSLAGLWEGRDINLESIRQQAWPRQQHDPV